jgi:hypothetical protein
VPWALIDECARTFICDPLKLQHVFQRKLSFEIQPGEYLQHLCGLPLLLLHVVVVAGFL